MRRLFAVLAILYPMILFSFEVCAQSPPAELATIPGDFPDPSLIRVGDTYWSVATSSEWSPQFPLLYSKDLVHWQQHSAVFAKRPTWAMGSFWAPEISVFGGKYFVYYAARKKNAGLCVA